MFLDDNMLRFTVINDDGTEEYAYYDLEDKEQRNAAVQTLINQTQMLEELANSYAEELNHYYELERKN